MTRRRSTILDLPVLALLLPMLLYAVGSLAIALIDLPPMPWSSR